MHVKYVYNFFSVLSLLLTWSNSRSFIVNADDSLFPSSFNMIQNEGYFDIKHDCQPYGSATPYIQIDLRKCQQLPGIMNITSFNKLNVYFIMPKDSKSNKSLRCDQTVATSNKAPEFASSKTASRKPSVTTTTTPVKSHTTADGTLQNNVTKVETQSDAVYWKDSELFLRNLISNRTAPSLNAKGQQLNRIENTSSTVIETRDKTLNIPMAIDRPNRMNNFSLETMLRNPTKQIHVHTQINVPRNELWDVIPPKIDQPKQNKVKGIYEPYNRKGNIFKVTKVKEIPVPQNPKTKPVDITPLIETDKKPKIINYHSQYIHKTVQLKDLD